MQNKKSMGTTANFFLRADLDTSEKGPISKVGKRKLKLLLLTLWRKGLFLHYFHASAFHTGNISEILLSMIFLKRLKVEY